MPPLPTSAPKAPPRPCGPGPKPNGQTAAEPTKNYTVSRGLRKSGQKVVVYGSGGIGKSKLVSLLEAIGQPVLIADIEDGTNFLDVSRVEPTPRTFAEVRACLHNPELLAPYAAIGIDSLTRLEELASAHVLATVPHEKGHMVHRIEDYGFGKGLTHIYETMLMVLGDLDAIARSGKLVVCVCHDCTEEVPNPAGENYLQYQPRLQSPKKAGKVRERVREWSDHLVYIGWDLMVTEGGKAIGSGTRTIYPVQYASHWAKSRTLSDPIPYLDNDPEFWRQILGIK